MPSHLPVPHSPLWCHHTFLSLTRHCDAITPSTESLRERKWSTNQKRTKRPRHQHQTCTLTSAPKIVLDTDILYLYLLARRVTSNNKRSTFASMADLLGYSLTIKPAGMYQRGVGWLDCTLIQYAYTLAHLHTHMPSPHICIAAPFAHTKNTSYTLSKVLLIVVPIHSYVAPVNAYSMKNETRTHLGVTPTYCITCDAIPYHRSELQRREIIFFRQTTKGDRFRPSWARFKLL